MMKQKNQKLGIRHQASGIRHQASINSNLPRFDSLFIFHITVGSPV
ncbi:hypothetical protein [Nitrosomonas sp.]|nr:hypothetical protein [Nitrosomonas sp.]